MHLIKGDGPDKHGDSLANGENGQLETVIDTLAPRIGLLTGALNDLGLDLKASVNLAKNLGECHYKVVDDNSIASDFGEAVTSDPRGQLAKNHGVDVLNVHLNIYGAMRETALNVDDIPTDQVRQMTWAWEVGRCAGNLLHRSAAIKRNPIAIARIGMIDFFEDVTQEISGSPDVVKIDPDKIPVTSVERYYRSALPERLASSIGNFILRRYSEDSEAVANQLSDTLWRTAARPLELAKEFAPNFQPHIDLRDFAAGSPLNDNQLSLYIEHATTE